MIYINDYDKHLWWWWWFYNNETEDGDKKKKKNDEFQWMAYNNNNMDTLLGRLRLAFPRAENPKIPVMVAC